MNPLLVQLAIQNAPSVISTVRNLFTQSNPTAPVPTDEEVIAAYQEAFRSSIAKDDAWLAAHPESK